MACLLFDAVGGAALRPDGKLYAVDDGGIRGGDKMRRR
jgi:hypothetical protein